MKVLGSSYVFFSVAIGSLLLTQSCGKYASYEELNKPNSENAATIDGADAGKGGMSAEDMEQCLAEGGVIVKFEDKFACQQPSLDAAPAPKVCETEETDEGVLIKCSGSEDVLVRHGKDGKDGVDGKDGMSCQVESVEQGALITCGDDEPVLVEHGKDGEDGVGCTISEVEDGAIIMCGKDGDEVAIKHGKDGQDAADHPLAFKEFIDPCGPSGEGKFDETIIRLNDGMLLLYFEHGEGNRFLTLIDPETQAGDYVTTDEQQCYFTVNRDGSVTWTE